MQRTPLMILTTVFVCLQTLILLPIFGEKMLSSKVNLIGRGVSAILMASLVVAAIGFVQKKKQGVYTYLIFVVISQLTFVVAQQWSLAPFVTMLIISALGIKCLKEME